VHNDAAAGEQRRQPHLRSALRCEFCCEVSA